jgi:hypothetical protein
MYLLRELNKERKFIISKTSYNNSLSCSRYQLAVIKLFNKNFSKSREDKLIKIE